SPAATFPPEPRPSGADSGEAAVGPPVGTAVVRKILSPQMMGEENPRPGTRTRHATFLLSPHSRGASPRAIPLLLGPRQRGQSSSAAIRADDSSKRVAR